LSQITYAFVASGHQSVERAFQSIEAAARRSAKTVEGAYAGQERAARRSAAVQEREARRPASRLEQLAKQVERDQIRAAQREAREKASAIQYVQRIRERHFADQQRKSDAAATQAVRTEQRASKLRERVMAAEARVRDRMATANVRREAKEQERAVNHVSRIRDRYFEEQQRKTERAERSKVVAENRIRAERYSNFGRIGSQLSGMAIGGAVGVGVAGAAIAGAAVKDAYNVQGIANRLSINSRKSGQDFVDATRLRREFEATALGTNGVVGADQVGQGTQSFVSKTGRLDLARKFSSTFATTAAATDSSFGDIASAGAELVKKFQIETVEEMQAALASVTFGGKEGSFELADAAQKYAKLASAGSKFGIDKGVGGVRVLQGLSQVAMDTTGDRDTATTAVEAMLRQLIVESENIKKNLGVDVWTDDSRTKARDITKLLPEILAASQGDMVSLQDIFKDEGMGGVSQLVTTFNRTFQDTKVGKNGKPATTQEKVAAAREAASQRLMGAINAPGTWADMKLDAEQATQGPGERLVSKVGDKMLPTLDRMIDRFEVSDGAIDALVGTLDNLISAAESVGSFLGVLQDKDSPTRREERARKSLERANTELQTLPSEKRVAELTAAGRLDEAKVMQEQLKDPTIAAKRTRLLGQQAKAQAELGQLDAVSRAGAALQTKDQFAELYAQNATGDKEAAARRAAVVAQALSVMPSGSVYSGSDPLTDETEEQRRIRMGFAQSTAERRINVGGKADESGADLGAKGLAAAFAEAAKAAREAAPALRKLTEAQQPSISSG
jgi:hypothetical protein